VKVTTHATYVLGPDEILEIIADEEFQEEKCRATYAVDYAVSVRGGVGRAVVQTERTMPTEHIPAFALAFIGNRFTIHETQSWSGPDAAGGYEAVLKLHVEGAPMTGQGIRRLTPNGDGGSRDQIRVEIHAAIPLIGRKVEELAAPMVAAAAEIETELLAGRGQ